MAESRTNQVARGILTVVAAMEKKEGKEWKPTDEDRSFARQIALGAIELWDGLRREEG